MVKESSSGNSRGRHGSIYDAAGLGGGGRKQPAGAGDNGTAAGAGGGTDCTAGDTRDTGQAAAGAGCTAHGSQRVYVRLSKRQIWRQ